MEQAKRECGSCTKCCEGWLSGEAHGHKFWPGRPCHFMMKGGCSIYKDRPDEPCKSYKCQWLVNENIPYWMKPNQVNAIITAREENGIRFLDVAEAGEKLRADVLSWIIMYALNGSINLMYRIDGGINKIGNKEFLTMDGPQPKGE